MDIGIVTITYDEHGKASSAFFTPTMRIEADLSLKQQLSTIKSTTNANELQHNAQLMFASWFSTITDIELADRSEYKINSKVIKCERYEDGKVKLCIIEFTFDKI